MLVLSACRSFPVYADRIKMPFAMMPRPLPVYSSYTYDFRLTYPLQTPLFLYQLIAAYILFLSILHALDPLPSPAYGEGCSRDRRTFGT